MAVRYIPLLSALSCKLSIRRTVASYCIAPITENWEIYIQNSLLVLPGIVARKKEVPSVLRFTHALGFIDL